MSLHFKWLSDTVAAAGQIEPGDVAAIAASGFKSIVNNRPDGEGGEAQPRSHDIEAAARAAGLGYYFLPVISGQLQPEQIETMRTILQSAATPVFTYCRSGARSQHLYLLATSSASQGL